MIEQWIAKNCLKVHFILGEQKRGHLGEVVDILGRLVFQTEYKER